MEGRPEARDVVLVAIVERESKAGGACGEEHDVPLIDERPFEDPHGRVVLVSMKDEHGATKGLQRREGRPRAKRRHHPLLVVGIRNDPREDVLREPPADPGFVVSVSMRAVSVTGVGIR